eukprot:2649582-Alexandrium_andersonii.AAC.1
MSASLVGSEMCIRDRCMYVTRRVPMAAVWRAMPAMRASCACAAPRSPVSYTHLTLPTICSV